MKIGMNRTAINGSVIAAASSGRRIRKPQAPPSWRWIISNASEPIASPSTKMYENTYARSKLAREK